MSDVLFSSKPQPSGHLAWCLQSICCTYQPAIHESQGQWGTVAITETHYKGFSPVEDRHHLVLVIGAPALTFLDNRFLGGDDATAGTRRIDERWAQGRLECERDLSGPFLLLFIDKDARRIWCVTDMMMYIPVYCYSDKAGVVIGTHVDSVARAARVQDRRDWVSLADFVLGGTVVYPYTSYAGITQFQPAAKYCIDLAPDGQTTIHRPSVYWLPYERDAFRSISDAATALRGALEDYVYRITEGMVLVALLISGGEDSRAVAGLLPRRLRRDAHCLTQSYNTEAELADRVANAYGMSFRLTFRTVTHYVDHLPGMATMVGSCNQYIHAHSVGLVEKTGLPTYDAVFGGLLSDSLLKAMEARTLQWGPHRPPLIPELPLRGETRSRRPHPAIFRKEIIDEIARRRLEHAERVWHLRPRSAHEWYALWPMSMRKGLPSMWTNRRLMPIYEPFSASEVLEVAAGVPTRWKLNRRLFCSAVRPFLRPSKWISHADGRLPYFPWWVNELRRMPVHVLRKRALRRGRMTGYQGPWTDWMELEHSDAWHRVVSTYCDSLRSFLDTTAEAPPADIFDSPYLSCQHRHNLLQVAYHLATDSAPVQPCNSHASKNLKEGTSASHSTRD
jgi:asparagine synthetase B (glutamine-hydrolysing)